jgi:hypothetical protein
MLQKRHSYIQYGQTLSTEKVENVKICENIHMIEDLVRFVMFSKNLIAGCDLALPKPLCLGHQNLTVP